MLIINYDLFEKDFIVKLSCDSNWKSSDASLLTSCALKSLETLLKESSCKNTAIMIVDCVDGTLPDLKTGIDIASKITKIKSLLSQKLDCTIIYAKTEASKKWFDDILKVYTSARPIYMLEHTEDIKKTLKLAKKYGIDHSKDLFEQLGVVN